MDSAARPALASTSAGAPPAAATRRAHLRGDERGDERADDTVLRVRGEPDVLRARQCARDIGRLAGLDCPDQIHLGIAVGELGRELTAARIPVSITFHVTDEPAPALVLTAEWAAEWAEEWAEERAGEWVQPTSGALPPARTREEMAARLARYFTVGHGRSATRATRTMPLPAHPVTTASRLEEQIREQLRSVPPANALSTLHDQDRDLLAALAALRTERDRLRRATVELEATNEELEETNRGVVALYGELDSAVSKLRSTAHTLQQAMLSEPPSVEGIDICVRYRPAGARDGAEAGGDWYDAFRLSDGDLAVVVGDVVGHDTRAAATMGQLRAMLRGLAYHTDDQPHRALETLDRLVRTMHLTAFATGIYARLHIAALENDAPGVVMSWANAGHPGYIVIQPDRTSSLVEDPRDIALGVTDGVARTVCRRWFPMGSTILLYSDGLYERRNEDLDASISALLERATAHGQRPLVELCDILVDNAPEEDDLVLVALRLGSAGGAADHA